MGKYVVGILGAVALVWIAYTGINIASSGNAVRPNSVFAARTPVVVAHRPFNYELVSSTGLIGDDELIRSLFENPERVQHMYFGAGGKTILLERSKPWTTEIVKLFLAKNKLSGVMTAAHSLKLSNGWFAKFDKEFLVISQKEPTLSGDIALNWDYVDRKSTYSRVIWNEAYPAIENIYEKSDGSIVYVSTENGLGKHLADDQELFLDVIPEGFTDYRFYEKNYLRTLDATMSPAYDWIENGVAVVSYNGHPCVITDYIAGQDPIAILGDAVDESSIRQGKNSGFVRNTNLPKPLPIDGDWHIEVFNNRVFIAEDQRTIDAFIGAYEAGHTLSQQLDKYGVLFRNIPHKVSFRHLSPEEHRTISLLEGSRHTVVRKYVEPAEGETEEQPAMRQETPIRIEGGIAQLLPVQGSDFLFVVSKSNSIYGISKQGERWKKMLDNAPQETALSTTGKELIITTANTVHVLNQQGVELPGFPLQHSTNVTAACYYTWKGQNRLAVADPDNLTIYSAGKKVSSMKLPFRPREKAALIVWVNRGELTATVTGESKAVHLSIDRKRQLKSFAVPSGELVVLKTSEGPRFFGIDNNRFLLVNANGEQRELSAGAKRIAGTTNDFGKAIIAVQTGKTIRLFSESGTQLGSVSPAFTDIQSVSCLGKASGKMIVGILDGLSNNNYIYALNGKQLTSESFEGASMIVLHRQQDGSLLLLSQSNGYLVRYPVE